MPPPSDETPVAAPDPDPPTYRETLVIQLGPFETEAILRRARATGSSVLSIARLAIRRDLGLDAQPGKGRQVAPPHPNLPSIEGFHPEVVNKALGRVYAMLILGNAHEQAACLWRILTNASNPRLPYVPNAKLWPVGALVIHSADRKDAEMLMRVTGYSEADGQVRSVYARDAARVQRPTMYLNDLSHLLDPRDFGIVLSEEGGE